MRTNDKCDTGSLRLRPLTLDNRLLQSAFPVCQEQAPDGRDSNKGNRDDVRDPPSQSSLPRRRLHGHKGHEGDGGEDDVETDARLGRVREEGVVDLSREGRQGLERQRGLREEGVVRLCSEAEGEESEGAVES